MALTASAYDDLCYDGADRLGPLPRRVCPRGGLNIAHRAEAPEAIMPCRGSHHHRLGLFVSRGRGSVTCEESRLEAAASLAVTPDRPETFSALIGYDDVASITEFRRAHQGLVCPPRQNAVRLPTELDQGPATSCCGAAPALTKP